MPDKGKTIEDLKQLAEDDWILHFNDTDVKETAKAALALLKEQPKIVHCGECKHRSKEMYDYYGNPNDKRYVCQIHDLAKRPDWFCADGEIGEAECCESTW